MHRVLARQLRRTLGVQDEAEWQVLREDLQAARAQPALPPSVQRVCEGLEALLDRVSNTYGQHDRERELRDRSLSLSTDELTQANERLREDAQQQARIVASLRDTANQLLRSQGKPELGEEGNSLAQLTDMMSALVVERQRALHDLQQLQAAMDEHAIISITDLDGRITHANTKFCDSSGYSQAELLGNSHRIVNSGMQPPGFFRSMWATVQAGQVWHGEVCNRSRNGQLYWVAATLVPMLDIDGKPERYIAIRTDITQQKQLESTLKANQDFLRSLTDSMGEGVYALDAQGRCLFMNQEAQRLLGWSLSELSDCSFHDTVHHLTAAGELLPACDCPIGHAVRVGEIYRSDDQVFVHRSGRTLPVSVTAVPQRQDGRIIGQVVVFQDISERKVTERLIREARDAAEAASRAKSEFLANMSHEIRTPMNAVIGLSHLALETELDERQRGYLDKIQSSAKNLLGIINDILDFSKIEAGRLSIERGEFDLADVLDQVTAVVALPAAQKHLELLIAETGPLPVRLVGDAMRLTQVLTNLAANAVKFTEQGEVVIGVEVLEQRGAQVQLRFTVRDTGIGIAPELHDKLFDSFSQADASTTRKFGGTGLGLAICKRLVDLMGGSIGVESQPGQGSLFHCTLPFEVANRQPQTGADKTRSPATATRNARVSRSLRGARVLVVEDNAFNRQVVSELLAGLGVEVSHARHGLEALEMVQRQRFDLVLMDVQMPVLDGHSASRRIRSEYPELDLPIVALTAHAMAGDRERSLAAGMDDHLTKPIDVEALHAMLLKWVRPHPSADTALPSGRDASAVPAPAPALPTDLPGFDITRALVSLGNDTAFYRDLLLRCRHEHAGLSLRLRQAARGDVAEFLCLVHTTKSVAATVGAFGLAAAAREVENQLRSHSRCGEAELTELFRQADTVASSLQALHLEAPAHADGAPALPPEAVLAQLDKLLPWVRQGDLQALEGVSVLRDMLRHSRWHDDLAELERCIHDFDFDQALVQLLRLQSHWRTVARGIPA
ncbi:MAG TPA: ATP-binding protein [Macromonas sp.]|nr:ATP-binding protein [Macromonas sp.]